MCEILTPQIKEEIQKLLENSEILPEKQKMMPLMNLWYNCYYTLVNAYLKAYKDEKI